MSFKYKRSREELEASLTRQLANMRRSAEAYDRGALEEAERLAVTAYVLLHDGNNRSKSLLGQLGLKDQLRFVSSATKPPPGAELLGLPLCGIDAGQEGSTYFAPLGDITWITGKPGHLPFSKWWSEVVYTTVRGIELTRKNLVFALRTFDGGHVDGSLRDEAYHWLATQADPRVTVAPSGGVNISLNGPVGGQAPVPNGHWATMRQIAWELDKALIEIGL